MVLVSAPGQHPSESQAHLIDGCGEDLHHMVCEKEEGGENSVTCSRDHPDDHQITPE